MRISSPVGFTTGPDQTIPGAGQAGLLAVVPFSYVPQYKVWLASNHAVKGDVDDDAFWGRIRIVEFLHSFLDREDKGLKGRMTEPEVQKGVLAWAVEGARRWYGSEQGLVTPPSIRQAVQKQRVELDQVQQWLDECTRLEPDNVVTNKGLYSSYEQWCHDNGYEPKKATMFGRAMRKKGYEKASKKIGGLSQRGYRGLLLRTGG